MFKTKGILIISVLLSVFIVLTSCNNSAKTESGNGSSDDSGMISADENNSGASTNNSGLSNTDSKPGASIGVSGSTSTSKASSATTAPKDMGGYTFTIASAWMTLKANIGEHTPLFERIFYQRASEIEKEYNCKINVIRFTADSASLRTYIMAGKKIADLVESMPTWIPQNVAAGYLKDWNSVSGIDLKNSKWLPYANEISTQNGKVYGVSFLKPPEARYSVMFNKTLLGKNNINADSIYTLVKNNQWTMDKLREYAKATTNDTNNDGVLDTFGIAGKPDYLAISLLAGFGGNLVTKSGSKFIFSLDSPASKAAMSFYDNLVNTDKAVWVQDAVLSPASYGTVSENTYLSQFNTGKVAFLFWESWVLNQYTKASANFDYGILPIPLGGSNKTYASPAQNMRVMCITSTNKDIDKVVPIINALADSVKGYQDQNAWWEDIQADYFQSKDTQSLDMYKLILNSSMRDPGLSVESLEQAFYKHVVYESVFWKQKATGAAIDGLKNTYDADINTVYNK